MARHMTKILLITDKKEQKYITYQDVVDHETLIIEDNICYGYKINADITEIKQYEKTAYAELRKLLKYIKTHENVVLQQEINTQRYRVSK